MRDRFWDLPLDQLTREEWEALCDGCGKCCLNKIEYEDSGELLFTRVGCKLLDGQTCRCSSYENRHEYVPECVVLTPKRLPQFAIGCRLPVPTGFDPRGGHCIGGTI